jgi:hypothetical protein
MKAAVLAALAVAAEAHFEDVASFETFDASSCVVSSAFAKSDSNVVYPSNLTLKVPFQGEEMMLEMRVDRSLFAEDWQLVDDSGALISDDKEAFMCHYTGSVAGKKGSRVTLSVCKQAGINGLIETEAFAAEIQPMDPTVSVDNLGAHVIYAIENLVLPNNISYGEAVGSRNISSQD